MPLSNGNSLEGLWVALKNNNKYYGLNKTFSIIFSIAGAITTIALRAKIEKG
jgi:hypothetical protein